MNQMKPLLFIAVCFLVHLSPVHGQTFAEWFDQKKTQIKYLETQIAALGIYAQTVKKGYAIVNDGLTLIGAIKKGDFQLHSDYFSSLANVNPKIKSYWKVADALSLEAQIVQNVSRHKRLLKSSAALGDQEWSYIENVYTQLLNGCLDLLTELTDLTTDAQLNLKDDERITRIDRVYREVSNRYQFEQVFSMQASMLCLARNKEVHDVEVQQKINQIQ